MELRFAFLALNADHSQSGELWVATADFDRIVTAGLPIQTKFCVVAKFTVLPDEVEQPHTVRLELTKPDGQRVPMGTEQPVSARRHPVDPNLPTGASIIMNLGLPIEARGQHTFHILADGREVKTLPLFVDVEAAPEQHNQ